MKNKEHESLKQIIEDKLGWGTSNNWHSSVFTELSEEIHETTGVLLSVTTLKRFWGKVKSDSAPSITTLDALSFFAGYKSWLDFKLQEKVPVNPNKLNLPAISARSIYISIGFVLALIVIAIVSNRSVTETIDFDQIKFSSRVISETFPNGVVFDIYLNGFQSDSLKIQQSWDPTKTVYLKNGQDQATGIYYYPGHYNAKLIFQNKIIDEHGILLPSNGWIGTVDLEPIPTYYRLNYDSAGRLELDQDAFDRIDEHEEPQSSSFHYVKDFNGISGDDFSFSLTLEHLGGPHWSICKIAQIVVLGRSGVFVIPVSKPGCSAENSLMLSDMYLNGKENDLTAFSTEMESPLKIGVSVRNKSVAITFNDEVVYTGKYAKPIGDLVGFRAVFLGVGKIHQFSLMNSTGNRVPL